MSSLATPIPIILCGKTEEIGRPVSQLLRPEYEVIHFCQGEEAVNAELPHLLAGRDPQSKNPNDIGTHDYSRAPRAVMMGRGFSLTQADAIRQACAGYAVEPIAWIVADPKSAPPHPPPPGYAEVTTGQVKAAVGKWVQEGGVKDEVILF